MWTENNVMLAQIRCSACAVKLARPIRRLINGGTPQKGMKRCILA